MNSDISESILKLKCWHESTNKLLLKNEYSSYLENVPQQSSKDITSLVRPNSEIVTFRLYAISTKKMLTYEFNFKKDNIIIMFLSYH